MSILPFIFVIILLLSVMAKSFLYEGKLTAMESREHLGLMSALTASLNQVEEEKKKAFELKKEKKKTDNEKDKKEKIRANAPYRDKRNTLTIVQDEHSKLAIGKNIRKGDFAFQSSARLIRMLYENSAFFKEGQLQVKENPLEEEILLLILNQAKEKNSFDFEILCPDSHPLRPILYKMVTGTRHYDFTFKESYPPLSHFLRIGIDNQKALSFKNASMPVLTAFCGKEMALEIVAKEKKIWEETGRNDPITTEIFEGLLQKYYPDKSSIIKPLIQGSNKKNKSKKFGVDEATGISITTE